MNHEWMTYLASAAILQILFWGIYRALLNTRGDFRFERYFLLGGLVLSLIVPLLDFSGVFPESAWGTLALNPMIIGVNTGVDAASTSFSWYAVIGGMYMLAVALGLGRLWIQLFRLHRIIQTFPKAAHGQRMTGGRVPTSSFFQTLLWDETQPLDEHEKAILLAHEQAHIVEGHSFDRLFVELLHIFFWFNPILVFLKKDLMLVHEALADQAALKVGSMSTLARVLLRQVGAVRLPLTQTFSQPPVDRRVAILTRTFTSNIYIIMRMITSLCLIVMISFFWACTESATALTAQTLPSGPIKEVPVTPQSAAPYKAVLEVDVQPEVLNYRELQQSIGYPKAAHDNKIEGLVVFRILIDEEGKYVQHEIVKSANPIFEEAIEAEIARLRFKPAMKDGKPVQFWVSIPFSFKIVAFDNLLPTLLPKDQC
ncbi:MAG: M56 family metallopeptidase [Bacteroidota bacterium]